MEVQKGLHLCLDEDNASVCNDHMFNDKFAHQPQNIKIQILDVSRLIDEHLDEQPVVAEGGCALFRAQVESFPDLGVAVGHAHALAAAAGRGL